MSARVSIADLELAAMWLEEYNDGEATDLDGNPDTAAVVMFRVAAWLRAEAERRETDRAVRAIAAAHNVPTTVARTALRHHLARQEPQP